MHKNRRAVLVADVPALATTGGRVVDPPERLQQPLVADLGRVEPHLDRFCVAGPVAAHLLVGRLGGAPAGVADPRLDDAVDLAERRLYPPEATGGEGGAL